MCVCVCAHVWGGVWYVWGVHTCTLTPTQDSDVCVGFLRRICVELAHIASLIGEWHIGQRHPQFVVREIHQLEPAVLQSCGDTCETETVRIQSTRTQTWDMVGRRGKWEEERGESEREGDGGRQRRRREKMRQIGGEQRGDSAALSRAFSLIE